MVSLYTTTLIVFQVVTSVKPDIACSHYLTVDLTLLLYKRFLLWSFQLVFFGPRAILTRYRRHKVWTIRV